MYKWITAQPAHKEQTTKQVRKSTGTAMTCHNLNQIEAKPRKINKQIEANNICFLVIAKTKVVYEITMCSAIKGLLITSKIFKMNTLRYCI